MTRRFPPHDPDGGLAGERTDLAWNRSGIAVVVAVAIVLRRLVPIDATTDVLALGCLALGGAAWGVSLLIARRVAQTTHQGRLTMRPSTMRWVTAGTLLVAVAGFAISLFPPAS